MADIVLTTLNAKFIHAAFGLRYLLANLGDLQSRAVLVEYDINQKATDIAEGLLLHNPTIIGIGVYIWNAELSRAVVEILKKIRPDLVIVLGGPEVSYETEKQEITRLADYVITGEADLKFAALCREILEGNPPDKKVHLSDLPDLAQLRMPYQLYDERDVAHRIVYVEASRGCPFTCEFCLSSLEIPVRQFPIEPFLQEMEALYQRGVQHFKFVDRTFNLNLNTSRAILEFFLARLRPGLFLHFEMIPDRLPEQLREIIARFPEGVLQFEVGIQTFNPEVSTRIKRRQNYDKLADNFRFLRSNTGVHIHADLIAGLPGETMESFARGFDILVGLNPQEIQLGILKRLRGTPIIRHDAEWTMTYGSVPPYEILQNKSLSFGELQELRRFARHWDLVVNSGNFSETAPLLWSDGFSAFQAFRLWSSWLYNKTGRNHSIALNSLAELLFTYLVDEKHRSPRETALQLWKDFQRVGRSDRPEFLRPYLEDEFSKRPETSRREGLKRQSRHLAAG
ncbi:MAG: DUF4080 domain-containing protein [Verrucomicrobiales bacterium]